jgi:exopolyphosphatase/pppGpp-phosphohydrolase
VTSRLARIGAAVDVGSNSIHLLVAEVGRDGLVALADESVQLGLGDVVDREGHLPTQSRDAVVRALETYARKAAELGATTVTLLGTEPLRRASNRSVIQADVLRATGHPLQLLSHDAEAQLTLFGVTGGRRPDAPLLVVDVGGGSTEVIVAVPGSRPVVGALPTGSSRLTSLLVSHDPPTWFEINALRVEAGRLMEDLPKVAAERAVAVGGSATNLGRVAAEPSDPTGLGRDQLERTFAVLASRTAAEISARYRVSLRRAAQLAAGAALLDAVLARYGIAHLDISDASLREGAVIAAAGGADWLERLPDLLA